MTRQAIVVSRKMDTPTAVVAMLGMASLPASLGLLWGPSAGRRRQRREKRNLVADGECVKKKKKSAGGSDQHLNMGKNLKTATFAGFISINVKVSRVKLSAFSYPSLNYMFLLVIFSETRRKNLVNSTWRNQNLPHFLRHHKISCNFPAAQLQVWRRISPAAHQ